MLTWRLIFFIVQFYKQNQGKAKQIKKNKGKNFNYLKKIILRNSSVTYREQTQHVNFQNLPNIIYSRATH